MASIVSRPLAMFIVLVAVCCQVNAFTWMGKIKLPEIQSVSQFLQARKFDGKNLVVITGTSSGLGRKTTKALLKSKRYHVVCAVRDPEKMDLVAEEDELDRENMTIMKCDLQSFDSVRQFAADLNELKAGRPLDRVVLNAAVYQPSLKDAKWTVDGHEQQMQTNHLSHFLLTSLLLPEMKAAQKPRLIVVGSVTGNDNTVGGGGVYPIADLRNLEGLEQGAKQPISMADGYNFNGAKAYKDSKMMQMMMINALHEKYHRSTGISFASIYPGCIAESPLFREKRPWFRKYFPVFMKYITGGFVGEEEAGTRLFQVIVDPRCDRSGVYWSWNGGPRVGRGVDAIKNDGNIIGAGGAGGDWDSIYENDQSDKVRDMDKAELMWKYSSAITGADWMPVKAPVSPCPTLKVISFVTAIADKKEELLRATGAASPTGAGAKKPESMKEALNNLAF